MYDDLVFESDDVTTEEALREAMEYRLAFGKYKGTLLKDLLVSRAGRSYFNWVLNSSDAWLHIKEYFKFCLDFYQNK
jgi:hypothetical protein